jgi:hypothetical protein
VTLFGLVVAGFAGCSGKAARRSAESGSAAAGEASFAGAGGMASGEGGGNGEGADAGFGGIEGAGRGGSAGTFGSGGSAASGGAAGTMTLGGTSGVGASAGTAGAGASSGSAGTSSSEGGAGSTDGVWKCLPAALGDGRTCDCGCGIPDPDCDGSGVESCDVCAQVGGCAFATCPSNVAQDDNARCEVPEGWTCGVRSFGDGFCDCGCGVLDSDCGGKSSQHCLACPFGGCSRDFCGTIDPNDNSICTSAPYAWTCDERLYRDGVCDCACGFFDPDCETRGIEACERCDGEGSCSGLACPGLVNEDAIHSCFKPSPPPEWRCHADHYGDGSECHCGCGVQDPDCRENVPGRCEFCACGPCPASLHPNDPTQCAPPPSDWICPPEWYSDEFCDCGCGVLDLRCSENNYGCERCEGCAHGHCERIDQSNKTRCTFDVPETWECAEDFYYDDVCDCGCGTLDRDCLSPDKSDCDICNSDGSCSDVVCADPESTILLDDNTACSD